MVSNNILLVIFILIIIAIIVYFYFNYKNPTAINDNKVYTDNKVHFDNKINIQKSDNKKVRFDNAVKYNTYKNLNLSTEKSSNQINVDSLFSPKNSESPAIDLINSLSNSPNRSNSIDSPNQLNSIHSVNSINSLDSVNSLDSLNSLNSSDHNNINNVIPYNKAIDNANDPESLWDSTFGLPLMNDKDKKKFASKMHRNHQNYQKSFNKFTKYQLDNETLIKNDLTIDPFKTDKPEYKNKSIKDIYDQKVAGPKTKPKKIKRCTPNTIVYEDEVEMNGGNIKGTNLHGFDGITDSYKSAAFGNEF